MNQESKRPLTDTVFIRGLSVETVIGVYDWEKKIRQKLVFDIQMRTDIRPAAKDDAIELAINYALASQKVTDLVSDMQVDLVETVAERVAQMLLNSFSLHSVQVCVAKPGAVPNAQSVGVTIERFAS